LQAWFGHLKNKNPTALPGITPSLRSGVIPGGEASNEKPSIRFAHLYFCFHLSSHRQAWLGHLKTKIPLSAGDRKSVV
jgi:hypothetical protein